MDFRFKSNRGIEITERTIANDLLNEYLEENGASDPAFLIKFREYLKKFVYNQLDSSVGLDGIYICYVCKEETMEPICDSCVEKQDWVLDKVNSDQKTMVQYSNLNALMDKELEAYIDYYFPELQEKDNFFVRNKKRVVKTVNSKGKSIVDKYKDDVLLKGAKARFLYEITIPEKVLIEKNTLGKKFGDERERFLTENKLMINVGKVSFVLLTTAIFLTLVYFR